jgi:hypothetical protein
MCKLCVQSAIYTKSRQTTARAAQPRARGATSSSYIWDADKQSTSSTCMALCQHHPCKLAMRQQYNIAESAVLQQQVLHSANTSFQEPHNSC